MVTKPRPTVPRAIKERVLAEFRHRCAICGADRPQLHHIDEDPANNDPQNLLPLCPNHHLSDQHDPTAPVDPSKFKLFRQFKDPAILTPQFHPLFRRVAYLLALTDNSDVSGAHEAHVELVAFINGLGMGKFYHKQIHDLLADSGPWVATVGESDAESRRQRAERQRRYRAKLLKNRDKAIELIIEMLRYQDWPLTSQATHRQRAT
jgi:hypothetical protein